MKKTAARAPHAPITVVTQQRLTAVVGGTGGTIISQNLEGNSKEPGHMD